VILDLFGIYKVKNLAKDIGNFNIFYNYPDHMLPLPFRGED